MKLLSSMILISVFLFVASCSKDEDNNEGSNAGILTIKGVEYELVDGIIWDQPEEGSGQVYSFDIDLFSEGFDPVNETGSGDLVAMEMYTDLSDDLASGTYTHGINETYPARTFGGFILLGLNLEIEEFSTLYIITSGTIIVSKSGSVYEFTMNLTADEYHITDDFIVKTDSDVVISCEYMGTLEARVDD